MARHQKRADAEFDPDEIFLDSSNMSSLNTQQFEGWLERPISKKIIVFTMVFFFTIISLFLAKLWALQITKGESFAKRSEMNSLKKIPSVPERGAIYDRNGKKLAWNGEKIREYLTLPGVYNLLGYMGFPEQAEIDNDVVSDPKELTGKEGVEKYFNSQLRGKEGFKVIEVDASGNIQSENIYDPGEKGTDIYLSVDVDISSKMYQIIEGLAKEKGFVGGAGAIMDVKTGELLAATSYPEYDSNILTKRDNAKQISAYLNDKKMPFLNRLVNGLYLPGSVMKPFFALAALNEGIITPEKEIYSAGFISIPNPYFPDQPSVFKDWKAHGWVDMRKALAVSSDVYFYEIGGGYEGQKGLGIANLEKYARMFGFGTTTGLELGTEAFGNIPSPAWKTSAFKGDKWTVGNTYHTAIGQYGFQVTPMQIVRGIGAIASDGNLLSPTLEKKTARASAKTNGSPIKIDKAKFEVVKEGMRMSTTEGTSIALSLPQVKVAGKTGTAELGVSKAFVNSWVTGFFPYDNPRYSFVIVMEKGPKENTVGGAYVMRELVLWMAQNKPEYLETI